MSILFLALAVGFALVMDTAWIAFFRARAVGKFQVLREAGNTSIFRSSTGTFTLKQDARFFSYVLDKQRGSLKFSEIKGIEYRVNEKFAVLDTSRGNSCSAGTSNCKPNCWLASG